MKLPEGYVNGVAPKKATAMGGFGQTMLEKLGWQKGQGLGKNKQGRDAPVQVTRKEDNVGLGAKRGWDCQQDFATRAYASGMANVATEADEDHSSSDSSDEDIDVFASIANETTATIEEIKLSRQLAKGNNLGRFGARAGKLRRIQEQEAVLAGAVDTECPGAAPVAPSKSTVVQENAATSRASVADAALAAPNIVIVGTEDEGAASWPAPAPQASSWWGRKMFASSGWLSGLHDNKGKQKKATRDAFTHETQEAIYNNAMSKKVQGKTGMGKSRGRDAAADWKGKKTLFNAEPDPAGKFLPPPPPVQEQEEYAGPANSPADEGGTDKQSAAFLKAARTLLNTSKKGRLKRSRLEAKLCETLELSQQKVQKRLQKRIDSNKLVQNQQWITSNCTA